MKERASDLHLEPFENELRVRFRIDNVLYEPIKPLPKALQASIVSRIKIMGRLNIAEKRAAAGRPDPAEDRRPRLRRARSRRCRSRYGERVVMRLLPRTQELLDLDHARLRRAAARDDEQADHAPERDRARHRARPAAARPRRSTARSRGSTRTDKNIITIEDPVEIQLAGHRPDRGEREGRPHVRERRCARSCARTRT